MRKLILVLPLLLLLFNPVIADVLRIGDIDDMTGYIRNRSFVSFKVSRSSTSGTHAVATSGIVGSYYTSGDGGWYTYRQLWRFDKKTAGLPVGATITGAVLKALTSYSNTAVEFNHVLVEATTISSSFALANYNDFTGWVDSLNANQVYGVTILSDSLSTNGKSDADTTVYTFNAAGLAKIAASDTVQVWALSTRDIYNLTPSDGTSYLTFTDDSSWLEITYTLPVEVNGRGLLGGNISEGRRW